MKQFMTLLMIFAALPALASDGVIEINQTCAVNGGCFVGDTAGFPITIDGSAGRSYRLTGDLVIPNPSTTGIEITTSDIAIDLNDFAIIGISCIGAISKSCRPTLAAGSGVAVDNSSTRHGISVHDGSVTGMGAYGVAVGQQGVVMNVRVRWNGGYGILTGFSSTVTHNLAYQNGNNGIQVQEGSTVSGNTASYSGGNGITCFWGCTLSGNTSYSNQGDGIKAYYGSTISGNSAQLNGGNGIGAAMDSLVQRNTVRSNTGLGIALGTTTAYRENVINANTAGTVTLFNGVDMGANSCNGAATCP